MSDEPCNVIIKGKRCQCKDPLPVSAVETRVGGYSGPVMAKNATSELPRVAPTDSLGAFTESMQSLMVQRDALKSEVEALNVNLQAVSKHNLALGAERDAFRFAYELLIGSELGNDTPELDATIARARSIVSQYDTTAGNK